MKQSNNSPANMTINSIEELKSSLETADKTVKQIQSLSGKLSSFATELNNFSKIYATLQSQLSKSKSLIESIESNSKAESNTLSFQKLRDKYFDFENNKSLSCQDWSVPNRVGGTLSYLERYHPHISRSDVLYFLIHFLELASQYNGYAYGGINRDFLIPHLIFNANLEHLNFKDVDIWFKTEGNMLDFIHSFNKQDSPIKLTLLRMDDVRKGSNKNTIDKPLYDCFTRDQYAVQFDGIGLFIVDLVVSDKLPVNDFAVNLLLFKPKKEKLSSIDYSWFEVGHDTNNEYVQFSVKELIHSIDSKTTTILSKYFKFITDQGNDEKVKRIVDDRVSRMIGWGWNFDNFMPSGRELNLLKRDYPQHFRIEVKPMDQKEPKGKEEKYPFETEIFDTSKDLYKILGSNLVLCPKDDSYYLVGTNDNGKLVHPTDDDIFDAKNYNIHNIDLSYLSK